MSRWGVTAPSPLAYLFVFVCLFLRRAEGDSNSLAGALFQLCVPFVLALAASINRPVRANGSCAEGGRLDLTLGIDVLADRTLFALHHASKSSAATRRCLLLI